jgi:hypothetical protein
MKRAVLQWAGQEQAGSVQLMPFLESNCRSWTKLAAAAGEPAVLLWECCAVFVGRRLSLLTCCYMWYCDQIEVTNI